IYISPKILGATFCFIQYLFLPRARSDTVSTQPGELGTWICGAAAGLAIMSHSAAGLPALMIFAFGDFFQGKPAWRSLAVSGVVEAAVVIPWIVWTHYYSPNTGPLLKFLLTGDFGFSGPPASILDVTLRLYHSLSPSAWLQKKLYDLTTLGGLHLQDARGGLFGDPFARYDSIRAYQLFFLLPSLGPLIVPLVYYFWKRGRLEGEHSQHNGLLQGLVWSSVVCFAVQFVIMMAPHFLYHYPYFVVLALHVIAIVTLIKLSNSILRIAALLNYLLFLTYWIILVTINTPVSSTLGLACAFAILLPGSVIVLTALFPSIRAVSAQGS